MADVRRIAALVPNVLNKSPGQRVRIETWARYLGDYGWTVDFFPFEDQRLNSVLYRRGHLAAKAAGLVACYARHLWRIATLPKRYDVVFIYREAALIGPAILERLARRLGAPIVYDIDDPIFLYLPSVISGAFSRLKFPGKIKRIMRMSDQVIAINDLIAGYARKHNDHVATVPNFLDPDHFRPSAHPPEAPRIGWSGSVTTMLNLHGIAGPLSEIQQRFGTPVQVIGTGDFELPGVKLDIRQWTPETEVSDLQECNIGVLPVVDRPENEWKFFLKLVQYLSTGLAIVADRAGSNADVIQDGINGFIVDTPEQWVDRLSLLIEDKALRERMGRAARQTAIDRYSVKVQMPRVAAIFDDLLARATT